MLQTLTFYIAAIFAFVCLAMMLRSSVLMHAIAWFAAFLIDVAIFFALLEAPFLALGQLIIFTGGMIAILLIGIAFSGMSLDATRDKEASTQMADNRTQVKGNFSYKIITLLFLLTLLVSLKLFFQNKTVEVPVRVLAAQFFGAYWFLGILILCMFIAALLSAVFFLKQEK